MTVIEVDEPPVITGLDMPTYSEDRTGPVTTYTAVDPEDFERRASSGASLVPTESDFEIHEDDGVLTFKNQPDHELPADANRDNQYLITVQAQDETGETGQFAVTVERRRILMSLQRSFRDSTEIDYREDRTTAVATYRATDPEGADISWDLSGDDGDDFEIDAGGVLRFANQPDYEIADSIPTDDNQYEVTVEATDETNNTGEFVLSVVVTDFDEPPDLSPGDGRYRVRRKRNRLGGGFPCDRSGGRIDHLEPFGHRPRRFRDRQRGRSVSLFNPTTRPRPTRTATTSTR